jgi:methylmalonyl-CoA/ethylmalonyl-CoA epimerase
MMTTATMVGISRIGQIAINIKDLDRATEFYRDVMGLPLLFSTGKLTFFDGGGVRLMLSAPEKPEFDHPSSIIYFAVPNIKVAYQQMLGVGGAEDEPHLICKNARPRLMDDVLSGHRGKLAGSHE